MPVISSVEAIHDALQLAMRKMPETYLIGEGVSAFDAVFGTTKGLLDEFGRSRVIEMPISENGITGMCIGSAMMGMRPILSHRRVDFALLAIEQLFNAAAKNGYVSMGQHKVPLVIRMVIGRGWGQGPQHAQSLEAMFAMVPGLKVIMPSTPYEFKGLLLAAIEDDNPVVMLEHRWLHHVTGEVPDDYYTIPLVGSRVATNGSGCHATIVATSYMVLEAIRAADALRDIGYYVEVIDARMLRPLNMGPIFASVRKTGRLVTCDTGHTQFGFGAEVIASIAEAPFAERVLQRPVVRIGLPDYPTPSSVSLAETYYPSSVDIVKAVGRLCDIPKARVSTAVAAVVASRQGIPIDKPDPSFKGPF